MQKPVLLAILSLTFIANAAWSQQAARQSTIFDFSAAPYELLSSDSRSTSQPAMIKVLSIVSVDPNGNVAGKLKRGQLIVRVGDSPVVSIASLEQLVNGAKFQGDTTVTFWVADPVGNPNGHADRKDDIDVVIPIPAATNNANNTNTGQTNTDDTRFLADELGIEVKVVNGKITVDKVTRGKPADGELTVGDVINLVNNQPVNSLAKIVSEIKREKSDKVVMQISEGGPNGPLVESTMVFTGVFSQSATLGFRCKRLDWVGLIVTQITDPRTATALQVGDVLTAFSYQGTQTPITNAQHFDFHLGRLPTGAKIEVMAKRQGQSVIPPPLLPAEIQKRNLELGITYVSNGVNGNGTDTWKIQVVDANSLAEKMGLAQNDLLLFCYSQPTQLIEFSHQLHWANVITDTFGLVLTRAGSSQNEAIEYSPTLGMALDLEPQVAHVIGIDAGGPADQGRLQKGDEIKVSGISLFDLVQTATNNGFVDVPIERRGVTSTQRITLRAVDQLVTVNNYVPYDAYIYKKLPGQGWQSEPNVLPKVPLHPFSGFVADSRRFRVPSGTELSIVHSYPRGLPPSQIQKKRLVVANQPVVIDFGRQTGQSGQVTAFVSLDQFVASSQGTGQQRLLSWDLRVVRVLNRGTISESYPLSARRGNNALAVGDPPPGVSDRYQFTGLRTPNFGVGTGLGAGTWWVIGAVTEQVGGASRMLSSGTHPSTTFSRGQGLSSFALQLNPVAGQTQVQIVDLAVPGQNPSLIIQVSTAAN